MLVSLAGMVTSVSESQYAKAAFSMLGTPSRIITVVSVAHFQKACSPMLVMLAGMVIEASEEHHEKA